jgi:hypothetical protein
MPLLPGPLKLSEKLTPCVKRNTVSTLPSWSSPEAAHLIALETGVVAGEAGVLGISEHSEDRSGGAAVKETFRSCARVPTFPHATRATVSRL